MGHCDGLLSYMTRLLLMTFVACHPFPFCDLGCHSLLSLSSRAEMPPKNNVNEKKEKEMKQQLRITHDKSVKCFRNASHPTPLSAPPPGPPSCSEGSQYICENEWKRLSCEASLAILFKLARLISDIRADAAV